MKDSQRDSRPPRSHFNNDDQPDHPHYQRPSQPRTFSRSNSPGSRPFQGRDFGPRGPVPRQARPPIQPMRKPFGPRNIPPTQEGRFPRKPFFAKGEGDERGRYEGQGKYQLNMRYAGEDQSDQENKKKFSNGPFRGGDFQRKGNGGGRFEKESEQSFGGNRGGRYRFGARGGGLQNGRGREQKFGAIGGEGGRRMNERFPPNSGKAQYFGKPGERGANGTNSFGAQMRMMNRPHTNKNAAADKEDEN